MPGINIKMPNDGQKLMVDPRIVPNPGTPKINGEFLPGTKRRPRREGGIVGNQGGYNVNPVYNTY